jgi:hypothetical protein
MELRIFRDCWIVGFSGFRIVDFSRGWMLSFSRVWMFGSQGFSDSKGLSDVWIFVVFQGFGLFSFADTNM